MTGLRRAVGVAAFCLGVLLGVVSPSDAAVPSTTTSGPTPAPYPTGGGAPAQWSCVYSGGDATASPSVAPTGQDCAVTSWGADPSPLAVTMAPGQPISGTVSLSADQFAPVAFGLGVLVMIGTAAFVIREARPPTYGAPSIVGRRR